MWPDLKQLPATVHCTVVLATVTATDITGFVLSPPSTMVIISKQPAHAHLINSLAFVTRTAKQGLLLYKPMPSPKFVRCILLEFQLYCSLRTIFGKTQSEFQCGIYDRNSVNPVPCKLQPRDIQKTLRACQGNQKCFTVFI